MGIAEVAARAGVSPTTVSHVLSGRRPVSAATRQRVLGVIEELGYRPSTLARGLRTGRTATIALIIPDLANPFYPAVARGLQDVVAADGYHTFVCNTDARRDEELSFLDQALDRRVDGIVFAGFRTGAADLRPVLDAGVAVVMFGGQFEPGAADLVRSDDRRGVVTAVTHLLQERMTPVAFINGQPGAGPGDVRAAAYREALAAAGQPADPALVVTTDYTRAGGVAGIRAFLAAGPPPRAVMCANDLIAIGVLDVAREHGIAVPERLAVVGFDDIEAAALVTPALTTVINPGRELGQMCGRLLLERLAGDDRPPREVVIPPGFIRRESA